MGFWQILSAMLRTSSECSVAENINTCALYPSDGCTLY